MGDAGSNCTTAAMPLRMDAKYHSPRKAKIMNTHRYFKKLKLSGKRWARSAEA
jgi:hypothetical protein